MARRNLRIAFLLALVLAAGGILLDAAGAERTGTAMDVPDAPPRDNVTVATESARYGTIMAWNPDGSPLYYNDTYTKYFDVDPVAGTAATVEYAATQTIHTEGPTCSDPPCTRNIVERANLSTGETELVYARYDPAERAAEWHDHHRVDETHVLIADMVHDQVFLVDTETELVEWRWDAQSDYPVEGGGPYPGDWVHLNDIDRLPDGRIMVSLRNQDSVAFLDSETGLQANWTLGRDGDHDTLYEQHNPDYIPREHGGPAVVIADSENGRLVEYQREDGAWTRSWEWTDDRLQWPRDADRLPNGNTLVSDTHGSRLLEIAPNGSVVWSVPLAHPYDVERLGTGEGSTGGQSATSLNLTSASASSAGESDGSDSSSGSAVDFPSLSDFLPDFDDLLETVLPNWVVNGLFYVSPIWMGDRGYWAVALGLGVLLVWPIVELRWRFPNVGVQLPVTVHSGDAEELSHPATDTDAERTPEGDRCERDG